MAPAAAPEAYVLVTIPNASLTTADGNTFTGALALEYITFAVPGATRDVLLVLRLGAFEAPLDPARTLTASALPSGARRYVFRATRDDAEFALELPAGASDDAELFHSVLAEYAADLRGDAPAPRADAKGGLALDAPAAAEDLRGRFVLMNEGTGEVVGALDGSVRVREDASLGETGRERDPVVVELPEGADTLEQLQDAEVLVRAVPPEERDWMMKGAVFVSHVISGTTTLLTSALSIASTYYIAHSTPSPHASGTASPAPGPSASTSTSAPPPPPSRTLLLMQSPTTRKHLARIHTVSGGAVKLSSQAAAAVERLIERAVGADAGKGKARASAPGSPAPVAAPAPQYVATATAALGKPPLPPRSRGPSPAHGLSDKPPLPLRPSSRATSPQPPTPRPTSTSLGTGTRVALSAALILAALDESTTRLVDAGGAAVTAAVAHKYGTAAGYNAGLAAGTVRNVVLVYVDAQGLGRRAIVKRAAKGWVKARVAQGKDRR
ncbi:hypothetical protein BC834DRAFT_1044238 [Gloeopeniophorella convolvens]|nr:hypothetical protein BC834DRAFT_1044238 [Gloeopeniophorella convolvens]